MGKRNLRRVLTESGLPDDVVEELLEEFDPMKSLKDLVLSWESFRR